MQDVQRKCISLLVCCALVIGSLVFSTAHAAEEEALVAAIAVEEHLRDEQPQEPTHNVPTLFSDISNHWAEAVIVQCAINKIVGGYEDGSYRPEAHVTRAEFAAMINRAFGYVKLSDSLPFSDIQSSDWFYHDMNVAFSMGYMTGYEDGTIGPNVTLTREVAFSVLARIMQVEAATNFATHFLDASNIANWAYSSVMAMEAAGYAGGWDGGFHPQEHMTRAQIAQALTNIYGLVVEGRVDAQLNVYPCNVTIRTTDTSLLNAFVEGDIYVTEGVGNGDVLLDNVHIGGELRISGGGSGTVTLRNVTVDTLKASKFTGQPLRIVLVNCDIGSIDIDGNVIIEGHVDSVRVLENGQLVINGELTDIVLSGTGSITIGAGSSVATLHIDAGSALKGLDVSQGAVVQDIIVDGNIGELNVEGETTNVVIEGQVDSLHASGDVNLSGAGKVQNLSLHTDGQSVGTGGLVDLANISAGKDTEVLVDGIAYKGTGSGLEPVESIVKPIDHPDDGEEDDPIEDDTTPVEPTNDTATGTGSSGSSGGYYGSPNPNVAVSSLALNSATLNLVVGDEASLTVTFTPSNATEKALTWATANSSIATVDDGKVKAIAPGQTTITATSSNGHSATCTVNVVSAAIPVVGITIRVSSSSHDTAFYALDDASTRKISVVAEIHPGNATNQKVIWSLDSTAYVLQDFSGNPVSTGTETDSLEVQVVPTKSLSLSDSVKVTVSPADQSVDTSLTFDVMPLAIAQYQSSMGGDTLEFDTEVDYLTSTADALASLPTSGFALLNNGDYIPVSITWSQSNYDGTISGTYNVVGIVSGDFSASGIVPVALAGAIVVLPDARTIVGYFLSTDNAPLVTVASVLHSTLVTDALRSLSNTGYAQLSDGSFIPITIYWEFDHAYDVGSNLATGTVDGAGLPSHLTYHDISGNVTQLAADVLNIISYFADDNNTPLLLSALVPYATDGSTAIAELPTAGVALMSDSSTYIDINITWTFNNPYDGTKAGDKVATGTVSGVFGEGVVAPTITGKITVEKDTRTIDGYVMENDGTDTPLITTISVDYGTKEIELNLPKQAYAKLSDGLTYIAVTLQWSVPSYNAEIAGEYIAAATPDGYFPGEQLPTAQGITVTVLDDTRTIVGYYLTNDGSDTLLLTTKTVAFGTTQAALLLPATAYAKLSDGTTYIPVTLDWVFTTYKENVAGTYSATATPAGTFLGGQIPEEQGIDVTVRADARTIVGYFIQDNASAAALMTSHTVNYGTGMSSVNLPSAAYAKLSDGSFVAVTFTWDITDYDGDIAGTYTATATPAGTFPGGQLPDQQTITVTVSADERTIVDYVTDDSGDDTKLLTDLEVAYGTADALAALPTSGYALLSDGSYVAVSLTWDLEDYDGNIAGNYTATTTPVGTFLGGQVPDEQSITVTVKADPRSISGYFLGNQGTPEALFTTKTVDYGTDESSLNLPTLAYALLSDSTTYVQVSLTWTFSSYNGNVAGDYTATATPVGTFLGGQTTTQRSMTVTVEADTREIVGYYTSTNPEVALVTAKTVDFGTAENALGLPTTAYAKLSDDSFVEVTITWDVAGYNALSPKDYVATGTLTGTFIGGQTPENQKITITLNADQRSISGYYVQNDATQALPTTLTVALGTIVTELGLPTSAYALLSDGTTFVPVTLSWDTTAYIGDTAGGYEVTSTPVGTFVGGQVPDEQTITVTVSADTRSISGYYLTNDGEDTLLATTRTVPYGTLATALDLPKNGYALLSDGTTFIAVSFTWDTFDYKGNTAGTYTVTSIPAGTFPGGQTPEKQSIAVTVRADARTILGYYTTDDGDGTLLATSLTVPYGTLASALNLPTEAFALLSDETTFVPVVLTWDTASYNGNTAGTYTVTSAPTGTFEGEQMPDEQSISVTVSSDTRTILGYFTTNGGEDVKIPITLSVPLGTTEAQLGLPGTAYAKLSDGTTYVEVSLVWTFAVYYGDTPGEYGGEATPTGTFPGGQPTTEQYVTVTVNPDDRTIQGYFLGNTEDAEALPTAIKVEYGTAKADIGLPGSAYAKLSDDSYVQVTLVWSIEVYDGNTAGTYTATATPLGAFLPGVEPVEQSIVVTVEENTAVAEPEIRFVFSDENLSLSTRWMLTYVDGELFKPDGKYTFYVWDSEEEYWKLRPLEEGQGVNVFTLRYIKEGTPYVMVFDSLDPANAAIVSALDNEIDQLDVSALLVGTKGVYSGFMTILAP